MYLLYLLTLCFYRELKAQKSGQALVDSLMQELTRQTQDTGIINLQNAISLQHVMLGNADTALYYATLALKLAEKKNFKKGIGDAYNFLGNTDDLNGDHPAAIKKFLISLNIHEEIGNTPGIIDANTNIGNAYHWLGNEAEAIKFQLLALKIAEKAGDNSRKAGCFLNLGAIYNGQGNYEEALKNYFASLKTSRELGDKNMEANNYINLGLTYFYLNKYPEALECYHAAMKISKELKNKILLAYAYNGIGLINEMQQNYPDAITNNLAALDIQQETNDKYGISISYQNLGSVYTKSHRPAEGKKWTLKALGLSRELGDKVNLRDNYQMLMWADSALGDYKAAFEDHKMYMLYKDSLFNEDNTRKLTQSAMQYEFDKKQLADSLKNKEAGELAAVKLKRQSIITYASVVVGILLLALSILIYFYYKQLAVQKQKTERLRLSRDLHDDIGSTLSSMGMYSKIAIDKLQSQNSHEAFEVLDKMNNLSHKMSDQMNDLVWNINPDNDSLQQAADRMKLVAARVLAPQGITYAFNTAGMKDDVQLSIEQRKNLLLIFKEAVNNIIKYAACKNVSISLDYKNGLLTMKIADDGTGFDVHADQSANPGGNGIKNMSARMEELGGQFEIISKPGEGTTLSCSCEI